MVKKQIDAAPVGTTKKSRSPLVREAVDRAYELHGRGDAEGAFAELTAAIEAHPDEPLLFAARGHLRRRCKEWQKAIDDFDIALALKPDAPSALFLRGVSLSMLGKLALAISDFESCVAVQPHAADAYWQLGRIHESRGDLSASIDAYSKAFELEPAEYAYLEDELQDLKCQLYGRN